MNGSHGCGLHGCSLAVYECERRAESDRADAAEAARDEATRRLAVVEEAVRSLDEGMAEIDDKRPHRRAIARMQLTGAITRLRAALEKQP